MEVTQVKSKEKSRFTDIGIRSDAIIKGTADQIAQAAETQLKENFKRALNGKPISENGGTVPTKEQAKTIAEHYANKLSTETKERVERIASEVNSPVLEARKKGSVEETISASFNSLKKEWELYETLGDKERKIADRYANELWHRQSEKAEKGISFLVAEIRECIAAFGKKLDPALEKKYSGLADAIENNIREHDDETFSVMTSSLGKVDNIKLETDKVHMKRFGTFMKILKEFKIESEEDQKLAYTYYFHQKSLSFLKGFLKTALHLITHPQKLFPLFKQVQIFEQQGYKDPLSN